ncbi:MAG: M20/M25/M40 family metallo-hydrolase [Sporomusaceae bacterium]|nr:M20/M25/M40 family metallo-hydrolase [Sporomusaceae bacterium]
MVNKERVLQEFFELVRITCRTKAEREVADVLKQKIASYKWQVDVSEDEVGEKIGGNCGNVYFFLKGNVAGAPAMLLSAHLDCVEPSAGVEPVLKDGIITSAGDTILGGDDKAGVVAIMEALRVVHERNLPHGDIQVVFTVAEEGGVNGSKNMDPSWLKADFGFALDSSGTPGKIVTEAPGQNKIDVVVHGKTAHAGLAPEEGVNAIVVAGKALAALQQGRIDSETTANVGQIRGGGATNIVPDKVELFCEARSRDMAKLEAQTQSMVATFEQVAAENGAKATVTVKKAYGPFVLAADSLPVQTAVRAANAVGLTPSTEATGGGSDANFFNAYGVPTAVLAVGMSKVHTTDEYIREEHLYQTAAWVTAIIQAASELKK